MDDTKNNRLGKYSNTPVDVKNQRRQQEASDREKLQTFLRMGRTWEAYELIYD